PIAPGATWNSRRDMDDQDPPVLVNEFLDRHSPADSLVDARLGPARLGKGRRSDDASRPAIGDAEHDVASALIGYGDAVSNELIKIKASACLFELQPRPFRRQKQSLEFIPRHASTTSPFATSSWNPYWTAVTPKSGSRPKGWRM